MRVKKPIYLFPMKVEAKLKANTNPYMFNLSTGLKKNFDIVNYGKTVKGGALDIGKYFWAADFFYLNWIEHSSALKILGYLLIYPISKVFKKKIIWTHHNVHPHAAVNWFDRFVLGYIIKFSDHIVVHTRESYPIIKHSLSSSKVLHFFHPFASGELSQSRKSVDVVRVYDLLIWGRVRKSKGLIDFLDFLKAEKKLDDYKIKIVGKFENDKHFLEVQQKYPGKSITIENRFATDEELNELHAKSKFVFFPYTGKSVLNSAALVLSLPKGTPVIGPATGAFKELGEMELINVYTHFSEVLEYVDNFENFNYPEKNILDFCEDHTFEKFADFLAERLAK